MYLEGKDTKPGDVNRDEETLRKLASLGYLSTSSSVKPTAHGPENDPKRLVGIHNKLEIASELSESGDFSRAKKMLNEIIEERSDFVFVYLLLSSILRQEGNIEGAVAVLQGALAATKSDDRISFQLAQELVESGDLSAAHRIAQDLYKRNPGDPHSARLLAKCESRLGNRQKAAEILLVCIRDYPDFVDARIDLGRIYLEVKKYQVALSQFESVLSFNPESADAHYGRGLALEALRQPERALRAHTEALKFRPEFIDAHFRLGLIHEYLGHYSEALKHFNEVINLGPPLKRSQAEKLKARVRTKMKS